MIIQNSLRILKEISDLEEKIKEIQKELGKNNIEMENDKLLRIINNLNK